MKFQDISDWDIQLMKNMAVLRYVDTNDSVVHSMIHVTCDYLMAKGYLLPENLKKDVIIYIDSYAIRRLGKGQSALVVIQSVFEYLELKNFKIEKDPKRQDTWSKLTHAHYEPAPIHNNWWKNE